MRPPTTHVATAPRPVWCGNRPYLPATVIGLWFRSYGLAKRLVGVRGNRTVNKTHRVHNDYLPVMEIDAQTYQVRADGVLLTCEPASELPMAQKYFLF